MVTYLLVMGLAPLLYLCLYKNKHRDRVVLIVTCIVMAVLLALRSRNSGVDLLAYERMYATLKGVSFSELVKSFSVSGGSSLIGCEFGYALYTWVFAGIGLDFQFLIALQGAFCVYSAYRFIDKNSNDRMLSIVLLVSFGFFDYTYCIIRQALALAILFFAFESVKKRNLPVFAVLVLAAALFHRTAISFAVVYPLSCIKISWKSALVYCAASSSLIVLFPLVNKYVLLAVTRFMNRGYGYLSDIRFEFKEMLPAVIIAIAFLVVFMDQETDFGERDRTAFWAFSVMVPLEFIGLYSPIFSRLSTLTYMPFGAIAITNLLGTNKNEKLVRTFKILILVAAMGYYIFCLLMDKRGLSLIPYRTFFQDIGTK